MAEKEGVNSGEQEGRVCPMCGKSGWTYGGMHGRFMHSHRLLRVIIGLIILFIAFVAGVKVGEHRGGFFFGGHRGYGFPRQQVMYPGAYSPGVTPYGYGPGMMNGYPATTSTQPAPTQAQ